METEMDVENDSNALNINKTDIRKSPIKNDCNVLNDFKPQDKSENNVQKYDSIKSKLSSNLENNDVTAKKLIKANLGEDNKAIIIQNCISVETQNENTVNFQNNDTFLSNSNNLEIQRNNFEVNSKHNNTKITEKSTKSTKKAKRRIAIVDSDSDSSPEAMDIDEAPEITSSGRPNLFDSDDESSDKPSRNSNPASLTKRSLFESDDNSTSIDKLQNPELSPSRSRASFKGVFKKSNTKPKRTAILDSDEDDESSMTANSLEESALTSILKKKTLEEERCAEKESSPEGMGDEEMDNDESSTTKPKRLAILDSDSDDEHSEIYSKESDDVLKSNFLISRLSNICDSESSEDERENNTRISNQEDAEPAIPPTKYKKKSTKEDADKPKKMNAKDAAEQRKEIESESQRMMREKHVSLPYHRPKQRSLKEFLQNRSRFASAVPSYTQKASPSLAMKMSKNQIKEMTKKIEEREKEVQEFFKSESESEGENENNKSDSESSNINNQEATEANDNEVTKLNEIPETIDNLNEATEETAKSIHISQTKESSEEISKEISQTNESTEEIAQGLNINFKEAEKKAFPNQEEEYNLLKQGEDNPRSLPKYRENNEEEKHGEDTNRNLPKHEEDNGRNLPELEGDIYRNLAKQGDDNNSNLSEDGKDNDRNLPELAGDIYRNLPKQGEDNNSNLPEDGKDNLPELGEDNYSNFPKHEEDKDRNLLKHRETNLTTGEEIVITSNPVKLREEPIILTEGNILVQNLLCQQEENMLGQTNEATASLVLQEGSSSSPEQIEEIILARGEIRAERAKLEGSCRAEKEEEKLEQIVEPKNIPAEKSIIILRIDTIRPAISDENAMNSQDLQGEEDTAMDCDFSFEESEEEPKDNLINKISENIAANNLKDNPRLFELEEENAEIKKPTRLELLKQQFSNTMPKLSGGPNFVIDLEEGVTKPSEVSRLMERFIQHTSKRKQHKSKIELSVMSVTSAGDIHQEKLAVKVDDNEQPEIIEKPGLKLKKLRDELQQQMAERRSKLWQQKLNRSNEEKANDEESVYKDEKSECCAEEDNLLDNEDEEELTDSESSEEEVEEDDIPLVEKKRPKCDLLDEEAEEDEDEVEEAEEDVAAEVNDDEEEEDPEEEIVEDEKEITKKPMRRIIQNFDDEDDSDEEIEQTKENVADVKENKDLDSTDPLDDDYFIPPGQPRGSQTPARQRTQTKSDLLCLTPVIHLTGLQSLNSGSKFLHESPGSPAIKLTEPSPLKGNNCQKKLLFGTQSECNQEDLEALAELCSGKFPTQTQDLSNPTQPQDPLTTQDLADLCSGQFTGISGIESRSPIQTASVANRSYESIELQTTKEIQNLIDDNDDKIITQLLNEEELQEFKKKFESPIVSACEGVAKVQTPGIAARISFDSDDDDADDEEEIVVKKRKQHAIVDSDEENDPIEQEEEINLHDDDDSLAEEDPEPEKDDFNKDVEYDSEENEIDVNSTEPSKKIKLKDFFENEAELSESEWGSADEDEKDLDTLDIELGDEDKFDQDKVRKELERIHMRRVLDEDNREIKILQEMLLEDGELHGTGRQKQFRWKNVDMTVTDNPDANDDDDNVVYDDENDEEEWRKKRYEREIFLRKQMEKSSQDVEETDISLTVNSQVFQLGQKTRIKTSISQSITVERAQVERKVPFSLLSQRGSFLARPEQDLQRVAEYTKPAPTSLAGTSGPKKSKHYLFQKINNEPTAGSVEDKKRKASGQDTPIAIKKLRLNGLSPAEKPKPEKNTNRVKRLFSNW